MPSTFAFGNASLRRLHRETVHCVRHVQKQVRQEWTDAVDCGPTWRHKDVQEGCGSWVLFWTLKITINFLRWTSPGFILFKRKKESHMHSRVNPVSSDPSETPTSIYYSRWGSKACKRFISFSDADIGEETVRSTQREETTSRVLTHRCWV